MSKIYSLSGCSVLRKNIYRKKINLKELRYDVTRVTVPHKQNKALLKVFSAFISSTKEEFISEFKDIFEAIKTGRIKSIKINKRKYPPILFAVAAGAGLPLVPGSALGGYVVGKLSLVAYDKLVLQFKKYKSGQCGEAEIEKAYKELKQALKSDTNSKQTIKNK